jgi:hypothetical protein
MRWIVQGTTLLSWLLCASLVNAQPRALRTVGGETVGVLSGPTAPSPWRPIAGHPGRWDTGLWAAGHRGGLSLEVGPAIAAVPGPTAGSFVTTQITLETQAGTPVVELYCPEVDVRSRAPDGRVEVRVHRGDGVVFEGFTRSSLHRIGWGNCGSRHTTDDRWPAHWATVDATTPARPRLRGAVWWNEGRGCQRWDFRGEGSRLRLERVRRVTVPQIGVREEVIAYPFDGRPMEGLWMYDASVRTRWIRRFPRPSGLWHQPGEPGPTGAVWFLRFVRTRREGWTWIVGADQGASIRAYHPDDAQTWHRSRSACRAARGSR